MLFGRNIYAALAANYTLIFHVTCGANKLKDTFVLDRADPELLDHVKGWRLCPTFSQQLDVIVENLVHPDDRKSFLTRTRREAVLENLSRSSAYFVDFRMIVDGNPRYYELKFNALRDRGGRIKGFVAGFQDDDRVVRSKCLDATERMRRTMSFFSEHYAYACRRDLDDDTYTLISSTERVRKTYGTDMFFSDAFARYCAAEVYPEDRQLLLDNASAKTIRARLTDRPYYTVHFREIISGSPRWWSMRVNRLEGYPNEVVMAFNDTDEDVRRDIDRETKIATQRENAVAMDRILRALQSGAPLADPARFLEIVRERFDAESCGFVRHDFASRLAIADAGCVVCRGRPPLARPWSCRLEAFEPQLMDLSAAGVCEFGAEETAILLSNCADMGGAELMKGIRHHVAAPVIVGGRLRGSLNVDFTDDRPLSELELGNLRLLADVVAAAIERRELHLSLDAAQRRAEEERSFVSAVINLLPTPCFVKDAEKDFRYVRCNAAFARLLGLPQEEIVGLSDWDLLDPKRIATVRSHDHAALESATPVSYRDAVQALHGAPHECLHWKCRMTGPGGHRYILGVISDFED